MAVSQYTTFGYRLVFLTTIVYIYCHGHRSTLFSFKYLPQLNILNANVSQISEFTYVICHMYPLLTIAEC